MDSRRLAEVAAWLDQYVAASARLEAGSAAAVRASYGDVSDWFDPRQTVAAALAALAASEATRQAAAAQAAQFVSAVIAIMRGIRSAPTGRSRGSRYPRAANPFDVYSRPVWVYRDGITAGLPEGRALSDALERAELVSFMDRLLAERDAAIEQALSMGAQRYRRVLRPELSKTGPCDRCIGASKRTYAIADLMPIHDLCKCKPMPVVGEDDPAAELNEADLAGLGDRVLVPFRVELNNELGPYLLAA